MGRNQKKKNISFIKDQLLNTTEEPEAGFITFFKVTLDIQKTGLGLLLLKIKLRKTFLARGIL